MKIYMPLLCIYLSLTACSSKLVTQYNRHTLQDSLIDKWFHAVVNIESIPSDQLYQKEIWDLYTQHTISWEAYREKLDSSMSNTHALCGTAIFLKHHERYFLITARHVLADTRYGDTSTVSAKIILVGNANNVHDHFQNVRDKFGNMLTRNQGMVHLMNLSSVPYQYRPYILSPVSEDLAIISLSNPFFENEIISVLLNRGYRPITLSDIESESSYTTGQQMMAIGFPAESVFATGKHSITNQNSMAVNITPPFITHGIISKTSDSSEFFEGNIFVYQGSSGGPIISRNKLIGIISGQQQEEPITKSNYTTPFIPKHNIFLASGTILYHLQELEAKEKTSKRLVKF